MPTNKPYLIGNAIALLISLFSNTCFSQSTAGNIKTDSAAPPATLRLHHVQKWIVPAAFIGLGIYGNFNNTVINKTEIREERQEYFPNFRKRIDDYMQFSTIASVYLADAAGIECKHDFANRTAILFKSEIILMGIVHPVKQWTKVMRPDSSAANSFPSGHTAQAFLAATFLSHELGYKSIWYSVGGYAVATGIGTFRMLNNKHWVSDVLAGAGVGILSAELAYATHRYKWHMKKKITMLPMAGNGSFGIYGRWEL